MDNVIHIWVYAKRLVETLGTDRQYAALGTEQYTTRDILEWALEIAREHNLESMKALEKELESLPTEEEFQLIDELPF